MTIELSKEARTEAIQSIERYFLQERDERIGNIAAAALLNFFIEEIGPARASVVAYVAPLFSVVYGVVLLDELFTPWTLVGMALILGGSWLAARRPNVPDPEL